MRRSQRRSQQSQSRAGTRCQHQGSTRHFIHHLIAPPQLHEINPDKVVSGVIRHAEFNGSIPIVIGHQEQSQKCEFMWLCLRFWRKSCDLTRLQSRYGLGSWTVGFRTSNYPRNNLEVKNSGGGSRWSGSAACYLSGLEGT